MKFKIVSCLLTSVAAARRYLPSEQIDVQCSLLSDPNQVASKSSDYIIAGGSLKGLTLATHLTEDPEIQRYG